MCVGGGGGGNGVRGGGRGRILTHMFGTAKAKEDELNSREYHTSLVEHIRLAERTNPG